ncbi:ATP P2X receptor [Opisthorchis viverrini]|uniref:Uncharacterized protein n=2 Tax=Opisthorchis viverrini TaxID=6198 RepID=A0A075ADK1_OPIVI|nr:hypothetical protein T265_00120 [Opisthorchis viverrini]KER34270.1 hypothetical protein T265_00120 [Opisthorchis viverrini]OON23102.1 ATP P2X receptor [Opisthorchis viverrini]
MPKPNANTNGTAKDRTQKRFGEVLENMFIYDMPKVVRVKNRAVGLLNCLLRLSLLFYFLIFVMWCNKSYQRTDTALSGVMTKVRGVGTVATGIGDLPLWVIDEAEFTLQPVQKSGFFIITRIIGYTTQHYGYCAEARNLEDAFCEHDSHCVSGHIGGQSIRSPADYLPDGWKLDVEADAHGIFTGNCRQATESCEIYGWCPVQEDLDSLYCGAYIPEPDQSTVGCNDSILQSTMSNEIVNGCMFKPISEVLNYTVFIKNAIEFPYFKKASQNILKWMNETYLNTCLYNPKHEKDRFCPNFRIKDMLDLSGGNAYRLLRHGGVIAITIEWNCDLDLPIERCLPRYNFHQLDGSDDGLYDHKSNIEGLSMEIRRPLSKNSRLFSRVNGIQFWVIVDGEAARFNLFIFTMSFGSNLALLGLASIICDYLLFHCTRDGKRYIAAAHELCKENVRSIAVQTEK